MRRKKIYLAAVSVVLGVTALLGSIDALRAQSGGNFDIPESVIAGGGGYTQVAGNLQVTGTIGQAAAGNDASAGSFTEAGGFWPTGGAVSTTSNTSPTPSATALAT